MAALPEDMPQILSSPDNSWPPCLLLAADTASPAQHSGYTLLPRYIPYSQLVFAMRKDPKTVRERIIAGVLARTFQSRWYRLSSLQVELRAWRMLRKGFRGVVHYLWGDRDWGFLHHIAQSSRNPLCATFHTCPDTLPELFKHPALLQRLDAIILMSEVQRPFFESHGVSPDRIHVVHHGVDCGFFRPGQSTREGPFQVVSVGNYRRNFSLLRKVCERLQHEPDIRFKIVGPDYRRSIFADLGNVDFFSHVSDEELLSVYQHGSCMLMTVDAATANNALLEALACGLPIVSENVGGISEYTGTTAALLHPAGDAEALAASIIALRANPALRQSMGAASRAQVLELDWPIVGRKTAAVYQQLLATTPA